MTKFKYLNINPEIHNEHRFESLQHLERVLEQDYQDYKLPEDGLKEGRDYIIVKENVEEFFLRIFGRDFFFRPIRPGGMMYSNDYRRIRFLVVTTYILVCAHLIFQNQ